MIVPFSVKFSQSVWHSMCAARVKEERVGKTVAITENDDQL